MGHNPIRTRLAAKSVDVDSPHLEAGYDHWSAAVWFTVDTLKRLEVN